MKCESDGGAQIKRSKKIKIEQVLGRMGEERAILKTSERKGIDLQEAVYKEE